LSDFGGARRRGEVEKLGEDFELKKLGDLKSVVNNLLNIASPVLDGSDSSVAPDRLWKCPVTGTSSNEVRVLSDDYSYFLPDFAQQFLGETGRIRTIREMFEHPLILQVLVEKPKTPYETIWRKLGEYGAQYTAKWQDLTSLEKSVTQDLHSAETAGGRIRVSNYRLYWLSDEHLHEPMKELYDLEMDEALRVLDIEYDYLVKGLDSVRGFQVLFVLESRLKSLQEQQMPQWASQKAESKKQDIAAVEKQIDDVKEQVQVMIDLLDEMKAFVRAHWGFSQVAGLDKNKFTISDEQLNYLRDHRLVTSEPPTGANREPVNAAVQEKVNAAIKGLSLPGAAVSSNLEDPHSPFGGSLLEMDKTLVSTTPSDDDSGAPFAVLV